MENTQTTVLEVRTVTLSLSNFLDDLPRHLTEKVKLDFLFAVARDYYLVYRWHPAFRKAMLEKARLMDPAAACSAKNAAALLKIEDFDINSVDLPDVPFCTEPKTRGAGPIRERQLLIANPERLACEAQKKGVPVEEIELVLQYEVALLQSLKRGRVDTSPRQRDIDEEAKAEAALQISRGKELMEQASQLFKDTKPSSFRACLLQTLERFLKALDDAERRQAGLTPQGDYRELNSLGDQLRMWVEKPESRVVESEAEPAAEVTVGVPFMEAA
ncbi:MAG: hypothetical protein LBG65_02370 [Puniceicoccales bacterium]|jgi:hypothetical protein|nr:hypothetical protein [Puniceicoccales bacterium]